MHSLEWPCNFKQRVENHAHYAALCNFMRASDWGTNLILRDCAHYLEGFMAHKWDKPFTTAPLMHTLSNDLPFDHYLSALRVMRNQALLHIGYRDINQCDDIDDINHALSALAALLCNYALDYAYQERAKLSPVPCDSLNQPIYPYIIGMGKVGGGELNFSSDIDLILGYRDYAQNDDDDQDHSLFFHKVAQGFVRILHTLTEEGFVYRVDLRLRPFGESGPVIMSTNAMVNYYYQYGRDWERYALIKARAIGGDVTDGRAFLDKVNGFVYRKYIDYSMIDSLRTIKMMIQKEVARKDIHQDIKLGAGGIREVEFIIQAFQLIYGGHDQNLQQSALIPTLAYLAECGRITLGTAQALKAGYQFLRTIENRLQLVNDAQTHSLPTAIEAQQRLATTMGFADYEAFSLVLNQHRLLINQTFNEVFGALQCHDEGNLHTLVQLLSKPRAYGDFKQWLDNEGFTDSEKKASLIWSFHKNVYLTQNAQAQKRLAMILLHVFRYLSNRDAATQTLNLFLEVLSIISEKTPYLALLNEKSDALFRLLMFCERSPWVSRYLAKYPVLLDELINMPEKIKPLNQKALLKQLNVSLSQAPQQKTEAQLDRLRDFLHTHILTVAMADLSGKMPLMIVSDYLSEIAETLINKILRMAWSDLSAKHGHPTSPEHPNGRPDFIIVAYGKLGGLELGYQSDLDLIFLHDSPNQDLETDGQHKIQNADFFIKLTQRIIYYLTAQTASGTLYEVDARLRPSGDSGLIVSSFERFKNYQQNDAWVWEHQALIRARPIAGSETLTNAFNQFRKEVLVQKRAIGPLKNAIIKMRARLHEQHESITTPSEQLKFGQGGMIDIEFLVQYLVLAHAVQEPLLIKFTDNIRQLAALEALGRISSWDAMILRDTYREIRKIQHKIHLAEDAHVVLDYALEEKIMHVAAIYKRVFAAV